MFYKVRLLDYNGDELYVDTRFANNRVTAVRAVLHDVPSTLAFESIEIELVFT